MFENEVRSLIVYDSVAECVFGSLPFGGIFGGIIIVSIKLCNEKRPKNQINYLTSYDLFFSFRREMTIFAPKFGGYDQHDSQEFLQVIKFNLFITHFYMCNMLGLNIDCQKTDCDKDRIRQKTNCYKRPNLKN